MGRVLAKRFIITGTLTASTPVHVGGAGDDLVVDMPLARDGKNRVYIPGTSLAGPIRAWWSSVFCETEADRLFGRTPDSNNKEEGHASYIRIDDAPAAAAREEIRDGVGIDRVSGAAADGIKYDRAVSTCGTSFTFHAEIDVPAKCDPPDPSDKRYRTVAKINDDARVIDGAEPRFGALIAALERGDIRFGAARTRGLGCLKLSGVCITEERLDTKAGLLALVGGAAPPAEAGNLHRDWIELAKEALPARRVIDVTVTWRPKLPVMSKSSVGGLLADTLPFVTAVGGDVVPVIAGSSIKGALRSHAERIWRTLEGKDAPNDDEPRLFIRQLDEAELPNLLFGAVADSRRQRRSEGRTRFDPDNRPIQPGLGAVTVDDCRIGEPIPCAIWDKLVNTPASDKPKRLRVAREIVDASHWREKALPIAHAAIDRWTGGAAEGALFAALELKFDGPHTIHMSIDLDRIACFEDRNNPLHCPAEPNEDDATEVKAAYPDRKAAYDTALPPRRQARERSQRAALALLLFTLRDFGDGRVPLGFGTNRGLGSVEVIDIGLKGLIPGLPQGAAGFSLLEDNESAYGSVYGILNEAWQDYWERRATGKKSDETS